MLKPTQTHSLLCQNAAYYSNSRQNSLASSLSHNSTRIQGEICHTYKFRLRRPRNSQRQNVMRTTVHIKSGIGVLRSFRILLQPMRMLVNLKHTQGNRTWTKMTQQLEGQSRKRVNHHPFDCNGRSFWSLHKQGSGDKKKRRVLIAVQVPQLRSSVSLIFISNDGEKRKLFRAGLTVFDVSLLIAHGLAGFSVVFINVRSDEKATAVLKAR